MREARAIVSVGKGGNECPEGYIAYSQVLRAGCEVSVCACTCSSAVMCVLVFVVEVGLNWKE